MQAVGYMCDEVTLQRLRPLAARWLFEPVHPAESLIRIYAYSAKVCLVGVFHNPEVPLVPEISDLPHTFEDSDATWAGTPIHEIKLKCGHLGLSFLVIEVVMMLRS